MVNKVSYIKILWVDEDPNTDDNKEFINVLDEIGIGNIEFAQSPNQMFKILQNNLIQQNVVLITQGRLFNDCMEMLEKDASIKSKIIHQFIFCFKREKYTHHESGGVGVVNNQYDLMAKLADAVHL